MSELNLRSPETKLSVVVATRNFLLALVVFLLIVTILPNVLKKVFPNPIDIIGGQIIEYQQQLQEVKIYTELLTGEPIYRLAIPVSGVRLNQIVDTWGAARSEGRRHEGVDIFAPAGTLVVAPTLMKINSIGYGERGGNFVFATASGRERYYFAHLGQIDKGLQEGQIIQPGDTIGTVGNTGNAINTPPHLHFGIYTLGGAVNPYPRLIGSP